MPRQDADTEFWLDFIKDVKPYKKADVVDTSQTKANRQKIKIAFHHQYAAMQDFSTDSKFLEDEEYGGIDKSTLRRFKREEFKSESVLDLHGMNENQAFDAVEDFIVRSYNTGKRCVIIITGKGLRTESDDIFATKGILKKDVPQWLNLPRLRAMILIFKYASNALGGDGALYILLRRNRKGI